MKRILLACAAGMSTSLLVTKMEAAAKAAGEEAKIWAVSEATVPDLIGEFDVLLIGPQIRFKEKEFVKLADGRFPVKVIDMRDYGTMNGQKVVTMALDLYNDFYNK